MHLFGLNDRPLDRLDLKECPDVRDMVLGPSGNKPKDVIEQDLRKLIDEGKIPPSDWFDECLSFEMDLGKDRKGVKDLFVSYKKKMLALDTSFDDAVRKLAVGVDTCRILSMAWAMGGEHVECLYANPEEKKSEYELLVKFWELAEQATGFFAYNGIEFDFPIILTRSAYLGVPPNRRIDLNRWNGDIIDPIYCRPKAKQKNVVDWNEIAVRDDSEMHGGQVYDYFQQGRRKDIIRYNKCDVSTMRDLFKHFSGYFWM